MDIVDKLKKLNNLSEPAKASIAFTICSIMQKGISVITVPIFTRLLTTEQYGVFSVYSAWYSIIQIFATLNLFLGVFNNGMIKYEKDRDGFQASMLGLSTIATVLVGFIYIVGRENWDKLFKLESFFIYIMLVELLFVPAFQFWSARQRFSYKYKELVLVTLGMSFASPVLGIIAVLSSEYKAEARVFSFVAVQIIVGIYFYIITFKKSKSFYVKEYWKYALAFNIPLIPHYLSGVVLNQSDRVMINNMVGIHEAAIYSVAYNLAYMVSMVTTAINNSFVPYTYQKLKENSLEDIKKISKTISLLVAISIILIMAFGPEVIALFAPPQYYEAIWVIPPVAASVFVSFMYGLFVNIEFFYEKNKFIMFASCIGAFLNIILNIIFIKKYGYIAAGYTTLVCYIVFMFAHYIFYKKIIKAKNVGPIYDMKYFVIICSIVLATMFFMNVLYNNTIFRYMMIIVGGVMVYLKKNKIMEVVKEVKNK